MSGATVEAGGACSGCKGRGRRWLPIGGRPGGGEERACWVCGGTGRDAGAVGEASGEGGGTDDDDGGTGRGPDDDDGANGATEPEPDDATGSDRPTYRERRAAWAERLREWADKREAKADAASARASDMASVIPFGQPILVGHYSEGRDRRYRDRIHNLTGASVEHSRKAESMRSRADNIESAADRAIYSDDPDAIERLREKVADLEGQRARIKAYNAACRKGGEWAEALLLLDPAQRRDVMSSYKAVPAFFGPKGEAPAYYLQNLGGLISRTRKRLAQLERKAERQ